MLNEMMLKKFVAGMEPRENDMFQALSQIAAEIEKEQAVALEKCVAESDVDVCVQADADARKDELLKVAEYALEQDLARYWFEEAVGLDNYDEIEPYLGISADEWAEQMREWYRQYYDHGAVSTPVEEATEDEIGQIAEQHVREQWGLSLSEFVSDVVNYSRARALETLLAGPIRSHTAVLEELADDLERKNERIRDLEKKLQE